MSRSYPYPHLQQPAPLQGLPLHLVNGIDCEKYLRNSGGLRCWLGLFSVQLCNYAVSGYQGFIQGEGGGGRPGISPQTPNLPPNFLKNNN